jgi:putative membrane protein/putative copper resistance protein D
VTATGIGGYGMELLSVHMIQRMTLSMLAPIPLLLGAPGTLALRALCPAGRGRRGARELLLLVLHSRCAAALTSPFVTLPLLTASLYGLYFTPLFTILMRTWWGHDLMLAHFLAVGSLFYFPLLAVDPTPRKEDRRLPPTGRSGVSSRHRGCIVQYGEDGSQLRTGQSLGFGWAGEGQRDQLCVRHR